MLHQPTIEKLINMRLQGMVDGQAIEQDEAARDLAFEDKLALIVDRQYTWRQNLAFQQRLKRARLRGNACVEDIDYRAQRGIDKTMVRGLAQDSSWVQRHENIFIVGPTVCGHRASDGYDAAHPGADGQGQEDGSDPEEGGGGVMGSSGWPSSIRHGVTGQVVNGNPVHGQHWW